MSKIVVVCYRNRNIPLDLIKKRIKDIFARVTPDNLIPNSPRIDYSNGLVIGVFNPTEAYHSDNKCAYLGMIFSQTTEWNNVESGVPDGTFSLFRYNKEWLDCVADAAALTTIWYAITSKLFIAATSQRFIVYFLESFKPNYKAFSWILSSGCLGPNEAWDCRIKRIKPSSRVTLNRNKWSLKETSDKWEWRIESRSDEEHMQELKQKLMDSISGINIDSSRWILPLSGGYDSRFLLMVLRNRKNLLCVTWGAKASLDDTKNDAYIAKRLARHYGFMFNYHPTDIILRTKNDLEKIFNRFIISSEGRIDHLSSFADGLQMWKTLFESKRIGIIRGTQAFGWHTAQRSLDVYRRLALKRIEDYENLEQISEHLYNIFGDQRLPVEFEQEESESLAMWRDRLFIQYFCPIILAALNDIKLTYINIVHPYMSKNILNNVSKLPDHLRNDKYLFKKIVSSLSPPIPFGTHEATTGFKQILNQKDSIKIIAEELRTDYAKSLLSKELINFILSSMNTNNTQIKKYLDRKAVLNRVALYKRKILNKFVSNQRKLIIDINLLAFRAYLICKMNRILTEDSTRCK